MDATTPTQPAPTAETLKEDGNAATKSGEFTKAVLLYTHAIKLDPKNAILHSNRSFAFFKLKQYSLAFEDAMETIRLKPDWAKGYFRKGEIEFATRNFQEAQVSYEMAVACQPDDPTLLKYPKAAELALFEEYKWDAQIPWLGAGIGIIVGVALLIVDYLLSENPTHPILMALVSVAISLVGYAIAKSLRILTKSQSKTELNIDKKESEGQGDEEQENVKRSAPKYTKSQARHRYKKGKM